MNIAPTLTRWENFYRLLIVERENLEEGRVDVFGYIFIQR